MFGIVIKNIFVFGFAAFWIWFFSAHQIIENGIVGLIVGTLMYKHFEWHPFFCILIGACACGILFLITSLRVGLFIKTIIFSIIVTFFAYVVFYSEYGLIPSLDAVWQVAFSIIFFLENLYIRLSAAHRTAIERKPIQPISNEALETQSIEVHKVQKVNQEIHQEVNQGINQEINQGRVFVNDDEPEQTPVETTGKDYEKIDNRFINYMSLKQGFWDSHAEEKVYGALRSFINENYIIEPHVGLREIFIWDWKKINIYEDFRVASMHFDFVIRDKRQWPNHPALVIEVWGKDHYSPEKPWVKRTDDFKQSILKRCKIPLVIINLSETMADEEINKLVESSIKKEVPSREFYTVYCPKCQAVMKIVKNRKSGAYFYGCSQYPTKKCNGRRDIEDIPKINTDVAPLYENIPIKSLE